MLAHVVLALSLALPQNGPAPTTPYLVGSVAASAPHTNTLTLGLPSTSLDPVKCGYIAFVAWTANTLDELASVPPPAGWTEIASVQNGSSKLAAYKRPYGNSSVTFEASTSCGKFEVFVGLWTNINLTSQVAISSALNLGFEHIVGGISAPTDDSLALSAWMSPDTPATFQPTLYTTQFAFGGVSRASTGSAGLCVGYSIVPIGNTGPIGAQSLNGDSMLPYFVNALSLTVGIGKT